jgi:uncharacterized C2H2 Zn-finger protein
MNESITYTFGRRSEDGMHVASSLPWQNGQQQQEQQEDAKSSTAASSSSWLTCPHCDKEFREERSRKCHIRDKHPDEDMDHHQRIKKKIKKTSSFDLTSHTSFPCQLCLQEETGTPRIFSSVQAFDDHIRAKHQGIHTYILPDWSQAKKKVPLTTDEDKTIPGMSQPAAVPADAAQSITNNDSSPTTNTNTTKCSICGLSLGGRTISDHFGDFLPVECSTTYQCDFCARCFREERAKLQHENFCSKRETP